MEKAMRIHLADTASSRGLEELVHTSGASILRSYEYRSVWRDEHRLWYPDMHVIVDSGAFTAHRSGRSISVTDYGNWIQNVRPTLTATTRSVHFISLDVIGDPAASENNLRTLLGMGLDVLPVVTFGDTAGLLPAFLEFPYIALGGLVNIGDAAMRGWLDTAYGQLAKAKAKLGYLPKTHLLGVTKPWALRRYPAYSCDSSSWTSPFVWGRTTAYSSAVPRGGKNFKACPPLWYAIRKEVESVRALEQECTQLWRTRGVVWED